MKIAVTTNMILQSIKLQYGILIIKRRNVVSTLQTEKKSYAVVVEQLNSVRELNSHVEVWDIQTYCSLECWLQSQVYSENKDEKSPSQTHPVQHLAAT